MANPQFDLNTMRTFLLCLFFAIPLAGCEGLMPKLPAKAVPDWVLSTPGDTREWMWGVGEGPDLDTAKRAALKDVAAKLRVAISGQLTSQVSVDNNIVDRQARSRIVEEVQKTEFSQYKVEQTAQSVNGFFVLVKVDRQAFVRDLKQKLGNLESGLQTASVGLAQKTPLERFVALRGMQPDLERAAGYAQLLVAAEPDGQGTTRLRHFESLQLQARQAPAQLVFQIQAGPDEADLATAMTAFLNENGIRIGEAHGSNVLSITSSSRTDVLYGSKLLKLRTTLSLLDDQGRILASRDHDSSGASTFDFRGARQIAIVKLMSAMREAGLIQSLGFSK